MRGQFYIKIALPLVILILRPHFVTGFATEKCQHDKLKSQIEQMFQCLNKSQKTYLDEMSTWYRKQIARQQKQMDLANFCPLYQQALDEQSLCWRNLVQTCFGEKLVMLESDFFSTLAKNCTGNDLSAVMKQNKLKDLLECTERIIGPYPENVKYIMSIIAFDKPCSYEQRIHSINGNIRCCLTHGQVLVLTLKRSKSLPLCQTTEDMLGTCFSYNQCFSQQEINLIRRSISTFYTEGMESLSQMSQFFSNTYSNVTGLAVQDYRTGTCKRNMKQLSFIYSVASQLSSNGMIIELIVLIVIVIQRLNIFGNLFVSSNLPNWQYI